MGDLDVVIGKRGVSGALGVPGAVAPHWSRDGTTKPIDEFVEAKARGIRSRRVCASFHASLQASRPGGFRSSSAASSRRARWSS